MFYIIEIQEQADGTGAMLQQTAATLNEALSKWHTILSFAATSTVPIHSAVVLDANGSQHACETFIHVEE